MFIFAHMGITLGVSRLLARLLPDKAVGAGGAAGVGNPALAGGGKLPGRVKGIDYRLVLLGSMLPDLIDKPLGLLAPGLRLGIGRGIAHTLAFALILLTVWAAYGGYVNGNDQQTRNNITNQVRMVPNVWYGGQWGESDEWANVNVF